MWKKFAGGCAVAVIVILALIAKDKLTESGINDSRYAREYDLCNGRAEDNMVRFGQLLRMAQPGSSAPVSDPGALRRMQQNVVGLCMTEGVTEREAYRAVVASICPACKGPAFQ